MKKTNTHTPKYMKNVKAELGKPFFPRFIIEELLKEKQQVLNSTYPNMLTEAASKR